MDGYSILAGVIATLLAISVALFGFDVGESSVRDRCEKYGKAKVDKVMLTCSVAK